MGIRDLAKDLNLSTATVSIALFGDPAKSKLSAKTVERVRAYAKKVGYVPNRLARKIFQPHRNPMIGILLKQDNAIDRTLPVLRTAMDLFNESSCEYLVQYCDARNIVSTIETMLGFNVRQIILIGLIKPEYLKGIERYRDLELYILDFEFREGAVCPPCRCWMAMDRIKTYRHLVKQLCQQGFGPVGADANVARFIRPFLAEDALIVPTTSKKLLERGEAKAPHVCQAIREGRCRSLICHNDMLAVGIMEGVLKEGFRIPEDLLLTGFNAMEMSAYTKVALSSFRPPVEKHLRMVIDHLIHGKELPDHVISEPEMFWRASTGNFVWTEMRDE